MLVDALVKANNYLNISSYISDPAEYWKVLCLLCYIFLGIYLLYMQHVYYSSLVCTLQLDDTILKTIETAPDTELKESRDLVLRIRRRELYQVTSKLVCLMMDSTSAVVWCIDHS